jgi:hypothetical protein
MGSGANRRVRVAALYDVHGNLPALTAEVVGFNAAAHQTAFHAFSWTKQGGLIDLGPEAPAARVAIPPDDDEGVSRTGVGRSALRTPEPPAPSPSPDGTRSRGGYQRRLRRAPRLYMTVSHPLPLNP